MPIARTSVLNLELWLTKESTDYLQRGIRHAPLLFDFISHQAGLSLERLTSRHNSQAWTLAKE